MSIQYPGSDPADGEPPRENWGQHSEARPQDPYQQGPYSQGPNQQGPYQPAPNQPGPHQQGPYQPGPYQQGPYGGYRPGYGAPQQPGSALAVTSLVLGIIAIVLSLIPLIGLFSVLLGLGAVAFGVIALIKKSPRKGMSITGIVLGALGAVIAMVVTTILGALFGAVENELSRERTVEYVATTSGEATVTYFDGEAEQTETISAGSWTEEIRYTGLPLSTLTVTPADAADENAEVSCEIIINGESVAQNSSSGAGAAALCFGSELAQPSN